MGGAQKRWTVPRRKCLNAERGLHYQEIRWSSRQNLRLAEVSILLHGVVACVQDLDVVNLDGEHGSA